MLEINIGNMVAEVREAFQRYEAAHTANDVPTLDELFWDSPYAIRYGAGENLYGFSQITDFRRNRSSLGLDRRLRKVAITTHGRDFATAHAEFERDGSPLGRQSQTWVRTTGGGESLPPT